MWKSFALHSIPSPFFHRTYRATIRRVGSDTVEVDVETEDDGVETHVFSRQDIERWNQPHTFRVDGPRHRKMWGFEDGITADYGGPLLKAKMSEIAYHLDPLVQSLDWDAEASRSPEQALVNVQTQQRCVAEMRRLLDITRLQDGVDRDRYVRDQQVGKLVTFGQGHCHGLSSVMAAALYPFSRILGIDIMCVGVVEYLRINGCCCQERGLQGLTCVLHQVHGRGRSVECHHRSPLRLQDGGEAPVAGGDL